MMTEHRTQVRHNPTRDVFLSLGRSFIRVGSIRDISLGGAAFEYFAYGQFVQPEIDTVDIFICREDLHIIGIPCRIIYELRLPDNDCGIPLGSTMVQKRCGIAFTDVNGHHHDQLKRFLEL